MLLPRDCILIQQTLVAILSTGCNNNDDGDETLLTPGSLRSTNIVAPYSPSVTSVLES
jgi:hypothetical protein